MANSVLHGSSIGCIKHARFSILIPQFDASGAPTDPTTPDTEVTIDAATSADATEEEATISGIVGLNLLTLTGAETNCTMLGLQVKNAAGPKVPLAVITPRVLPIWQAGTATTGAAGSITLPAEFPSILNFFRGAIVRTTGGTGGGGTGGANNQARLIVSSTIGRLCAVEPNFETAPDATTTFDILITPEWLMRVGSTVVWGTAVTGTLSTTQFTTSLDLSASNAQQYVGRILEFTGGTNVGALRVIQACSAASNSLFTVKALPGAPSNLDPFVIR